MYEYKYESFIRTKPDLLEDIQQQQLYYCEHMPVVSTQESPESVEERRQLEDVDLDEVYYELGEGCRTYNQELVCENLDLLCRCSRYRPLLISKNYLKLNVGKALMNCLQLDAGETLILRTIGFISFAFRMSHSKHPSGEELNLVLAGEFPLDDLVTALYELLPHYPVPALDCLMDVSCYGKTAHSRVLGGLSPDAVTNLSVSDDENVCYSFWRLIRNLCRSKEMPIGCVDLVMGIISESWPQSSPKIRVEMIWIFYQLRDILPHRNARREWAQRSVAAHLEELLFSGFTPDDSQLCVASVQCYLELIRYVPLRLDFFVFLLRIPQAASFCCGAIQRIMMKVSCGNEFLELGLIETIIEMYPQYPYTTKIQASTIICHMIELCETIIYPRISRLPILSFMFDAIEGQDTPLSLLRQVTKTILRIARLAAANADFEFFRDEFASNDGFETFDSLAREDEELCTLVNELKAL